MGGCIYTLVIDEIYCARAVCLLGVGNPSPLNTCPKCPPQAVQTISVRVIPKEVSSCLLTAPGMAGGYRHGGVGSVNGVCKGLRTVKESRPSTSALDTRILMLDLELGVPTYIEFR